MHEIQPVRTTEERIPSNFPGIHLESGRHGSAKEIDRNLNRVQEGDLSVHGWNPEVAQRIQGYKPSVLAIDSLFSGRMFKPQTDDKMFLWYLLPDRPSKINDTQQVRVICGDINPKYLLNVTDTEVDDDTHDKLWAELGRINRQSIQDRSARDIEYYGTLALSSALLVASFDEGMQQKPGQNQSIPFQEIDILSRRLSRRAVLRAGVVAGAAGILYPHVNFGARFLSSRVTDERLYEIVSDIAALTKTRFVDDTFVDARTALIICKTQDYVEQNNLQDEQVPLILGVGHLSGGVELLSDRKKRNDLIIKYATELKRTIGDIASRFPEVDETRAVNALMNIMSRTDIVDVTDTSTEQVTDMKAYVDEHVHYRETVYSPQVEAALAQLREV